MNMGQYKINNTDNIVLSL